MSVEAGAIITVFITLAIPIGFLLWKQSVLEEKLNANSELTIMQDETISYFKGLLETQKEINFEISKEIESLKQ